jgi:IclR family KDG regulon transcriptional repressor
MRSDNVNSHHKQGARSESLRRGLEILLLLSVPPFEQEKSRELGISQVALKLGLHKSQVHRAMKTLEDMGFLQKNPETGRYCLGLSSLQVGTAAEEQSGFFVETRPLLRSLAERAEAAVSLRILVQDKIFIVESAESPGFLRVTSFRGARLPWDFGAGSKVLTAFAPPGYAEELIRKHGLTRFTDQTIVDPETYLDEVVLVRERGYSISNGEGIKGSYSVAIPVFLPTREQVAVLVAATPSVDLTEERASLLLSMTKKTGDEIMRLMNERHSAPQTINSAASNMKKRMAI